MVKKMTVRLITDPDLVVATLVGGEQSQWWKELHRQSSTFWYGLLFPLVSSL